ncbi:MAG TPA: hypothetical protein VGR51_03215, partial [Thermoplasmata archaeon]|nr:hypothetical protein [Thermoplasmata archaeon]
MIVTAFSQLVKPASAPSDGGDSNPFEEQARRMTIAAGASTSSRLAWSSAGALHLAWIDARDGTVGVYHKASRNGGLTFGPDRAIARGFDAVAGLSLSASLTDRTAGIAWQGRLQGNGTTHVYVAASSDDGRT